MTVIKIPDNLVKTLTSQKYANTIRNHIKDNWTSNDPKYYGAVTANPDDSGTCHVSVVAPDGSAVSATSTINQMYVYLILLYIRSSTSLAGSKKDRVSTHLNGKETMYPYLPYPVSISSILFYLSFNLRLLLSF